MDREEFKKDTIDKINMILSMVREDEQKDYEQIKELLRDIYDSLSILCVQEQLRKNFRRYVIHELNQNIKDCGIGRYNPIIMKETIDAIKVEMSP